MLETTELTLTSKGLHELVGVHKKYNNHIAEDGTISIPATVTAVTASMIIHKQCIHGDNMESITVFS